MQITSDNVRCVTFAAAISILDQLNNKYPHLDMVGRNTTGQKWKWNKHTHFDIQLAGLVHPQNAKVYNDCVNLIISSLKI